MFQSATLKLTAWYLAILVVISVAFSIVIYQINTVEIDRRLHNIERSVVDFYPQSFPSNPRELFQLADELDGARRSLITALLYINLAIVTLGGTGAYFLARRTLRPIHEALEAQARFTSDASHELRTPLSAMKTELEVALKAGDISKAEAKELVQSNLEEVNKLIDLSEVLLKLARLDHDKVERTAIDFVAVLSDKLRQYKADKKRLDTTTRKALMVSANEAALRELFGIFIDNALKYSPKQSKIHIRVFAKRGMAGFEIKNETAQTIPKDALEKLFDRFYRADTSRTQSNKRGYGLGLSIAQKIIDLHEGTIEVKSLKNTVTFTFYLPIIKKSQAKIQ